MHTPPHMRATLPSSSHPRLPPHTPAQSSVSIANEFIHAKHIQNAVNKRARGDGYGGCVASGYVTGASLSAFPRVNLSVAASIAPSAHATVAHTHAQDTVHTSRGHMIFFSQKRKTTTTKKEEW